MRAIEKRLRIRIECLENEAKEITLDRQQYRDYFSNKLRWFIELQGKGTTAATAYMIEDLAKLLQRTQWFNW